MVLKCWLSLTLMYFLFSLESFDLGNTLFTHGTVGLLPLLDLNADGKDFDNDIARHQATDKGGTVNAEAIVLTQAVHNWCWRKIAKLGEMLVCENKETRTKYMKTIQTHLQLGGTSM